MNAIEQQRFTRYQEIFDSKEPDEPQPEQQLPTVPKGAASATKTMGTRRNNYGGTGLSREGRQNIQNAPRKQG